MHRIELPEHRLNSLGIEIDRNIRKTKNFVYKYSPNSQEVALKIDRMIEETNASFIVRPLSFWYRQNNYMGYMYRYQEQLRLIQSLLKDKTFSKTEFLNQIISCLAKLYDNELCYYDIHSGNILVDQNGKPFFLDIDGATSLEHKMYIAKQSERFVKFIFHLYSSFSIYLTNNGIEDLIYSKELDKIFQPHTVEYIKEALSGVGVNLTYPFSLIDELENKSKAEALEEVIDKYGKLL